MKKRLEAELISIAHRILKLKNKSEVDQLYKETQKLYETLAVLKFYQDNFEVVKSDVEEGILEEKVTQHLDAEAPVETVVAKEETVVPVVVEAVEAETKETEEVETETVSEEALEPAVAENGTAAEEVPEEPTFKPIFELASEEETEEAEEIEPAETASEVTPETPKVTLESFLGEDYTDPVFVKPNEVSLFSTSTTKEESPKTEAATETFSKSIAIGLNDRIGFVQHLFGESNEDFNRVLSQLNTFDTFEEAKNFIDDMIKPDYNNWEGAEDYAERFLEVVENKFK